MPASAPKPEGATPEVSQRVEPSGETRGLPFQWNLLAWAALVGILTGVAVVIFHELLGLINSFLYGQIGRAHV